MKRLFDIFFSSIVLLLFLPFGVIIGLIILLTSRGGVFYIQERIGKNGKPFGLYKFRTMRKNSDKAGKLTVGMRDPRITGIGYFIRKFKLDEFPQFINVLMGQMSVVGPRPEVKEYTDLYTPYQRDVLSVKPGITDYASLQYYDENRLLGESKNPRETYINEIMPAKIELNRKYIENPTLGQDFKIVWLTFLKVIGRN
ncbi:MAG: glycosyl transferase [Fluviicola sp.]|nr:MAG: glycosyl transferase [Fluviicola sp.]